MDDTVTKDWDILLGAELRDMSSIHQGGRRRLYFSTEFVKWILNGTKTATTRVDNFVFEDGDVEKVGDLKSGDVVDGVDDEERTFAVLEITKDPEKRTYESIDDQLAKIENFKNAKELKLVLKKFYKELKPESPLVVVYFRVRSSTV